MVTSSRRRKPSRARSLTSAAAPPTGAPPPRGRRGAGRGAHRPEGGRLTMYGVCVSGPGPPPVLSVLIALSPLPPGAALAEEHPAPPGPPLPRRDQLEPAV